jgi:DNA-binding response OmpR family regulator
VVTVHPSTTRTCCDGGDAFGDLLALDDAVGGREEGVEGSGDDGTSTDDGSGPPPTGSTGPTANSATGSPVLGVPVRNTGSNANDASVMLASVAAHHPSTGRTTRDRIARHSSVHAMAVILLIEDDRIIAAALSRSLTDAGHLVRAAGTAADALKMVNDDRPDLVILDLGLPDIDGADALRMMRSVSDVPVIVATARRGEGEIIKLLNLGADDYVTKPFSAGHILARVNAVLRRNKTTPEQEQREIKVGGLTIQPHKRQATLDGAPLRLTRREFDVLAYLAERAGRVVSRRELMTQVWQQAHIGEEQTIDDHISWLRRKLGETAARPRFLVTVRGVGVMMVEPQ